METVEVVIRIDKNTFDAAGMLQEFVDDGHIINGHHMKGSTFGNMIKAIAKGTILPKGHGRLGDIDFEIKHYESILDNPTPDVNRYDRENAPVILKALRMIGTVIEPDREGDNEC